MNIDATNLIYGRLASYAAKQALLGKTITIFNCEKAVMTGDKKDITQKYRKRRELGQPIHGPFIQRMPDRFMRRGIRGMLPYKMPKGKEAFQRVMCYIGVPAKHKEVKLDTLPKINITQSGARKFIAVGELCSWLGGKHESHY